jgi:hypothetical protein
LEGASWGGRRGWEGGYAGEGVVGGGGQFELDLRDGAALGLAAFHRDELEEVAGAVEGGAAAAGERRVEQADRGVPADQPGVGDVAHPAADLHGSVRREGGGGAFRQLADRPGTVHGSMMTLSS